MNFKKLLTFSSCLVCAFTLASCGNENQSANNVEKIEASAKKSSYTVGDKITKDDFIVKATYDNKIQKEVSSWTCTDLIESKSYTYEFTDADATAGSKTFNISYLTFDTSVNVSVVKKVPTTIITKAQFMERYEEIFNRFQNSTDIRTRNDISSFKLVQYDQSLNPTVYSMNPHNITYVDKTASTNRSTNISFCNSKDIYSSNDFFKQSCANIAPDVLTNNLRNEGLYYLIGDSIRYYDLNNSATYWMLQFDAFGYVTDYWPKGKALRYVVTYDNEPKPKSFTSSEEWLAIYNNPTNGYGVKFQNETNRYTRDQVSIEGYIAHDLGGRIVKTDLYEISPLKYDDTANARNFLINLKKDATDQVSISCGGGDYYAPNKIASYLDTSLILNDIEYVIDNNKQTLELIEYNRFSKEKCKDIVFNKNGYIEKYYLNNPNSSIPYIDIKISYNGDPQNCLEYYPMGITKIVGTYVSGYGYLFNDGTDTTESKSTFSFLDNKVYRFTTTIKLEDFRGVSGETAKLSYAKIQYISFIDYSGQTPAAINLSDLIEGTTLKAYKNFDFDNPLNVEIAHVGMLKLSNEIDGVGTTVTFEFKTKKALSCKMTIGTIGTKVDMAE